MNLEDLETCYSALEGNVRDMNPDLGGPMEQPEFEELCGYESRARIALDILIEGEDKERDWENQFHTEFDKAFAMMKPYMQDEPCRDE